MNPTQRVNARAIALGVILLIAALATFAIVLSQPAPPIASSTNLKYSYLIDVAGWYEITPNESAVASAYDFSFGSLKALPEKIGRWNGSPYPLDPSVDEWFENPDVALSSLYRDDRDHQLWFSMFGSRSRRSYSLFEHTPITSYPAAGWTLLQNGVTTIPIGPRHISVQQAWVELGGERRVVFYWYLWNDFSRDPEKGVLTVRAHIPVISTDDDARSAGEDFLSSIFPQAISWHRF